MRMIGWDAWMVGWKVDDTTASFVKLIEKKKQKKTQNKIK